MRVRWTTPAADEFERTQLHYESVNPHAARVLAERVHAAISQLRTAPSLGRHGHMPDVRERVVSRTPYIVVYRQQADAIEILHVFHQRQNWTRIDD